MRINAPILGEARQYRLALNMVEVGTDHCHFHSIIFYIALVFSPKSQLSGGGTSQELSPPPTPPSRWHLLGNAGLLNGQPGQLMIVVRMEGIICGSWEVGKVGGLPSSIFMLPRMDERWAVLLLYVLWVQRLHPKHTRKFREKQHQLSWTLVTLSDSVAWAQRDHTFHAACHSLPYILLSIPQQNIF